MYVTRDNPVLTNDSLLLQQESQGIFERSERQGNAWSYRAFEFQVTQSGLNLARGTDTETTLAVWPTQQGVVEPPEGQTAWLNWSIPGARVGYSDLTLSVTKLRTVRKPYPHTEINREAQDTKLRLRPDVILVPIQVAQFVADYPGAPDPRTTDILNEPRSRLLFDEAWRPKIQRSSYEGYLDELVGHWETKNEDDYFGWAENYTPDSIFEQCGIQFRMVKHVEVRASKEWWEMADSNGNPLCTFNSEARLRSMRGAAVDAGLEVDLPILIHTRVLMNPSCAEYDVVQELACNGGNCGGANWAAIDRYHVGDFNQYVLSHELGHVLGMADLASGSTACSGAKKHLMCQFTSRQSENLQDGPPGATCEIARAYAATYARNYFDTAGTDY